MLFPVRCFTCNKLVGHLWERYKSYGEEREQAFEEMNIKRYCCKRMFLTHRELIDELLCNDTQEELDRPQIPRIYISK